MTMTTDIALRDEMSVSELVGQVATIQQAMGAVMRQDEHYGIIPGVQKPSLWKPGAEKLCLLFRLAPRYTTQKEFGDGGHLTVTAECDLTHITSGAFCGSGQGMCSTHESKYAWRKGSHGCPVCGESAIIEGKEEYGGGWLCWRKLGGCGSKWPDNSPEGQGFAKAVDRVPNEDLPDVWNTVLKMATKRALVAAVLNVTAASDIFTQDIEDLPATATVRGRDVNTKTGEVLVTEEALDAAGLTNTGKAEPDPLLQAMQRGDRAAAEKIAQEREQTHVPFDSDYTPDVEYEKPVGDGVYEYEVGEPEPDETTKMVRSYGPPPDADGEPVPDEGDFEPTNPDDDIPFTSTAKPPIAPDGEKVDIEEVEGNVGGQARASLLRATMASARARGVEIDGAKLVEIALKKSKDGRSVFHGFAGAALEDFNEPQTKKALEWIQARVDEAKS